MIEEYVLEREIDREREKERERTFELSFQQKRSKWSNSDVHFQ